MSSESQKTGHSLFPLTASVKLKYVKLGYHYLVTNSVYLLLIPLSVVVLAQLSSLSASDFLQLCSKNSAILTLSSLALALIATVHVIHSPRKVYLLDFACYKPSPAHLCSKEDFMRASSATGEFTEDSLEFQRKILEKSGFGQMTYAPTRLLACKTPPDQSMEAAREETEAAMFGAIDDLLEKSGVSVREIGVLVVNSSLFNPTPSLSAVIVNRYKLRGNLLSYNLGGMGCSAGLISVDLARDLLQVHPNTYALVVSTENITRNWYFGNHRPMLVTNCLFRVGAAAVLLTNRPSDRRRSKYQLLHTVRTHKGADDKCYSCVFQQEDDKKTVGVSLSKDLMAVAGEALKTNITTLGPLVLPISEQILFLATLIAKKVLQWKVKPYIPDFKLAFEHFCIHAGGRGVLDEIEKSLELTEWHMEPSRMTLYRFGNTSSSSLWYELAYSEAKGRVKKGDRVWQIGFGSGFKCNSAVWRAVRTIESGTMKKNVWCDEIDGFPVKVPKVSPIVY
ncbi:3-ketoacyl-CoA synthase 2 [Linum grandiflorum]